VGGASAVEAGGGRAISRTWAQAFTTTPAGGCPCRVLGQDPAVTTRLGDLPRVLPTDPSWVTGAPPLPGVLHLVADAADAHPPGTCLLDTTAYWIAAATIARIGAAVNDAPIDSMVPVASLPAYQLQALQRVRAAVQRALDHHAGAERLLHRLDLLLDWRGLPFSLPPPAWLPTSTAFWPSSPSTRPRCGRSPPPTSLAATASPGRSPNSRSPPPGGQHHPLTRPSEDPVV